MNYQITPSQAKELLDHLQSVSDEEKEYIEELAPYIGNRNSYDFKSKDWGMSSALFQLRDELAQIYPDYFVNYDYLYTDFEAMTVKSRITVSVPFSPINRAVDKHNSRKKYMKYLESAYNMGNSLYIGKEDFKKLENLKEPIRKEYVKELVEQAKSLPPVKQEDLEEHVNAYLKKHNLYVGEEQQEFSNKTTDKLADSFRSLKEEPKSPVSCFTMGAIGGFIVFALGLIISLNV